MPVEGRGLGSRSTQEVAEGREIGVSLTPPSKVGKLQAALHTKAKNAPDYRFYALYDKLYRKDVLRFAYDRCRRNKGDPGVDQQPFRDIKAYGEDRWLDELAEELRNETYFPLPVRRSHIAKPDGGRRPLGIPCIKDR
jgi:RNA-directed DNA polymerase